MRSLYHTPLSPMEWLRGRIHSQRDDECDVVKLWTSAFKGGMSNDSDEVSVKDFLDELEKRFEKNEKAEIIKLLVDLVQMRYKAKGNIREYIMEMSNIASKLKVLKLDMPDDLLVYLVLISLPA